MVLGFLGQDVSEDVASLISDHYVGNIILMKRNVRGMLFFLSIREIVSNSTLVDAKQTQQLVKSLQSLAKAAGHERPLLIGIDQENGRS